MESRHFRTGQNRTNEQPVSTALNDLYIKTIAMPALTTGRATTLEHRHSVFKTSVVTTLSVPIVAILLIATAVRLY